MRRRSCEGGAGVAHVALTSTGDILLVERQESQGVLLLGKSVHERWSGVV